MDIERLLTAGLLSAISITSHSNIARILNIVFSFSTLLLHVIEGPCILILIRNLFMLGYRGCTGLSLVSVSTSDDTSIFHVTGLPVMP